MSGYRENPQSIIKAGHFVIEKGESGAKPLLSMAMMAKYSPETELYALRFSVQSPYGGHSRMRTSNPFSWVWRLLDVFNHHADYRMGYPNINVLMDWFKNAANAYTPFRSSCSLSIRKKVLANGKKSGFLSFPQKRGSSKGGQLKIRTLAWMTSKETFAEHSKNNFVPPRTIRTNYFSLRKPLSPKTSFSRLAMVARINPKTGKYALRFACGTSGHDPAITDPFSWGARMADRINRHDDYQLTLPQVIRIMNSFEQFAGQKGWCTFHHPVGSGIVQPPHYKEILSSKPKPPPSLVA